MNLCKVSIIIPVYNAPEVVMAVKSCIKQTYPFFEIIVVDDGSTINIKELLCLCADQRIKYVRNAEHINANVCRNRGLDIACGDYVIFLDADDMLVQNHIHESLNYLTNLQVDGIYSSLIWWNGSHCKTWPAGLPNKGESWANYLIRRGLSAQTSTLFLSRKSALGTRWDETLVRHQDYDFVVRYVEHYSLDIKSQPTVIYNATSFKSKNANLDDNAFYSCIRFSQTYKSAIQPFVYKKYVNNMLNLAKFCHANQKIIAYYEDELRC